MTKVLVVDDSNTMRKILTRSLNAVGLSDVVEAGDGAEALRLFEEQAFDLLLTDWNLPGISGLDVVRTIRAGGSKVPVIMVTTEAEKARVIEAIQAGVTDYVLKPFSPDVLRPKIEKWIGHPA